MSRSLYDVLHELNATGYTLTDLLAAIDEQLEIIRESNLIKSTGQKGRLFSIARTNIETGLLYAQKFQDETKVEIPIVHIED